MYSVNQTKESFPYWYHDAFWTDMTLISINELTYQLVPNNQNDWHITLSYINDIWVVKGQRDLYPDNEFHQEYKCNN